ncbi:plipastatin synthase subunit D [Brevibacillus laterosporus GI-9]|uniref:non-ribosomal peptide synthetase n=1 Tax=Brevibacillus laterosporus TaxID=1465 RepID=UPI00024047E4|nr:non-ribosomal peptide synthetase [Brevibacillus laterosporus]CCF12774.1 plipastatin synthase subunit D [Brevibacillus laterosporus GI-9]
MFDKQNVEDIYFLSPMQAGMLFHSLKDTEQHTYFEQLDFPIQGELSVELVEQAANHLISRYSILRTAFLYKNVSKPLQVVLKQRPIKVDYRDIRHLNEQQQHTYLTDLKNADKAKGFSLSGDSLTRYTVVQRGDESWNLIWSYHHILMDGWCFGIVMDDFFRLYEQARTNKQLPMDRVVPYSRYIKWLEQQDQEEALDYWKACLQNYDQQTTLPSPYPNGVKIESGYRQEELFFKFDEAATSELSKLAKKYQVTINHLFQAVWGILLQRYNNNDDVVFGAVVNGRPSEIEGIDKIVGVCINTIPVRVNGGSGITFEQLVQEIKKQALSSEKYAYVSLADIQAASDGGQQEMFDNIIVFQNYPLKSELGQYGSGRDLGFTLGKLEAFEQTNYGINVIVVPGKQLTLTFNYNANKYTKEFIHRIGRHLQVIIQQITHDPEIAAQKINIVTEDDVNTLARCNDTTADYPLDKTIHQLFEEQAARTPDQVAVVHDGESITYAELNRRANQLAHRLRDRGIQPSEIIGILAERSIPMVIGLLAIVKAGGAYLPIDPEYPAERITYMLKDSGARLLLTDKKSEVDQFFSGEVLQLSEIPDLNNRNNQNPERINTSQDILYAIYTSGTTGKPKCTLVKHRNLVNVISFEYANTSLTFDRVMQFTTISFDVCAQEIFSTLLKGGELHIIASDEKRDVLRLLQFVKKHQIETAFLPTALVKFIIAEPLYVEKLPVNLKHIVTAGEQLVIPASFIDYLQKHELQLHNHYGPSETHVVTTLTMKAGDSLLELVPIGRPIANNQIHILNRFNQLQPVGISGEIYIAGENVGAGYLNQPELTTEKFVDDPFRPGYKMYRTGDVGRYLADGMIEFQGRIDHQVKIRGYRIELGEIEAQLLNHRAVQKGFVTVYEQGGTPGLCAYYVPAEPITQEELRSDLGVILPDYMIPSVFIELEDMPLTPNNKIDRRALPKPDMQSGRIYVAPSNPTEETLTVIWSEILGVLRLGVTDNFFDLGGHSLKATMLVSRIYKQFNVDVPLKVIFQRPTVRELAAYVTQKEMGNYVSIQLAAPTEDNEYTATPAQKRIFVISQFEGVETSYNMPMMIDIEGEIDLNRLRDALDEMTRRHGALRTSFAMKKDHLVQRIQPNAEIPLIVKEAMEENVDDVITSLIQPFDLGLAPLARAALVRLHARRSVLLIDLHHIIADGVSIHLFFQELGKLYSGQDLPMPYLQYKDYAVWQQERLNDREADEQASFWQEQCKGELPVLQMPTDYPRPAMQSFEGDRIGFEIDTDLTNKLKELSAQNGSTLFMPLLAAYNVLLAKYTGQQDMIVGSAIAGRQHADLESIIGMFVNTIPLRNKPNADKTFRMFLHEVKENLLKAYEHQDYPLELLLEQLGLRRDLSRNPLFDTMFTLQNIELGFDGFMGLQTKPYTYNYQVAKFDLTLQGREMNDKLVFDWEYATKLFKRETLQRMAKHYVHILAQVVEKIDLSIEQIELVTDAEKEQLLDGFNRTSRDHELNQTIHALIEAQVHKHPEQTAVVYQDQRLSYSELNRRANNLAAFLQKKGVGAESIVAIMANPSLEMIVGVLAILKAGGAFLPIDPTYPGDRVQYMLSDSGTKWMLTNCGTNLEAFDFAGDILDLTDVELYQEGQALQPTETNENHLAYVIYTSGSTGQPKGVMVEHRSLVNLTLWHQCEYQLSAKDITTKYAGFGFDASVWEIFPTLVAGASLHVISPDIRLSIDHLNEYFEKNCITVSFLPTQICEAFMNLPESNQSLRLLLTGGDKLKSYTPQRYQLVNNYGPTENTVVTTRYRIESEMPHIPIGQPIHNVRVYVLNQASQLQPIGVPGELCVAGDSLARGYLNRPDLTAEKFVDDPFVPGGRMYRTGDLVSWGEDGNLIYLGRIDQQVKVRGYRVELGEIEAQLLTYPEITASAVTIHNDMICAYYIASKSIGTDELRQHLARILPDYMIPSHFAAVEKFPLTANGKVDYKALPKPDATMLAQTEYIAATTSIEETLANIWADVLSVERVGVKDNFFDLGGDSIKAIQIVARLNSQNLKLTIRDLFQNPTIEQVTPYISATSIVIEQGAVEGEVRLTPIQRWFFTQNLTDAHHWNQAMMLTHPAGIDEVALRQALQKLVEHHDALRMVYITKEDAIAEVCQINRSNTGELFTLEVLDLFDESDVRVRLEREGTRIQSGINLQEGPLVQAGLFRTKQVDYLLIAIHHLVVDGVSWRIILEDLENAYQQVLSKQPINLPQKTHSYQHWANELADYASGKTVHKELDYWVQLEKTKVASIPADYLAGGNTWGDMQVITSALSKDATKNLLTSVHHAYQTEMNDLLLTALGLSLHEWTGENCFAVELEGHGREDIIHTVDISRTVGWFTSMYPFVLDMSNISDLSYQIKMIKESIRQIPNKGIGYGILRYMNNSLEKEAPTMIKPEISFNYLGQFGHGKSSTGFQRAEMPTGSLFSPSSNRSNLIDITGSVADDQLTLHWMYSSQQYNSATIERLAEMYRSQLIRCIDHCLTKEGTDLTPSDVGYNKLSIDKLTKISGKLKSIKI